MSEYQYIAFRAIDAPVSEVNLAYMRMQSSRAEITPWSFTNEYHFGDFHGNATEMLRRGYDMHLHYANYGLRSLAIRLPHGFPAGLHAESYLNDEGLHVAPDARGRGTILMIEPFHDPDHLEELWELDGVLDRLLTLRDEILTGDPRPLYLAHLAVSRDGNHDPEQSIEAPVPAGLCDLTPAQRALAELYEISDALLVAAAHDTPAPPVQGDASDQYPSWLADQSGATKDAWLTALMKGSTTETRREILAQFREDRPRQIWPTIEHGRTIAQLQAAADDVQRRMDRQATARAKRQRAARLVKMAADPTPYLHESEQLVVQRSIDAYQKAAGLLADLREALAGTRQADLAAQHARKLQRTHPTRHHLTAALRKKGFLAR